jgi:hypothetical protein
MSAQAILSLIAPPVSEAGLAAPAVQGDQATDGALFAGLVAAEDTETEAAASPEPAAQPAPPPMAMPLPMTTLLPPIMTPIVAASPEATDQPASAPGELPEPAAVAAEVASPVAVETDTAPVPAAAGSLAGVGMPADLDIQAPVEPAPTAAAPSDKTPVAPITLPVIAPTTAPAPTVVAALAPVIKPVAPTAKYVSVELSTEAPDAPPSASPTGPTSDRPTAPAVIAPAPAAPAAPGNAAARDRASDAQPAPAATAASTEPASASSPSAAIPQPAAPTTGVIAAPAARPAPPVVDPAVASAAEPDVVTGAPLQEPASTELAAAVRDLGLSTLSRATIETTAQIAAQIVRRLEGRSTRFDMVLTPEGLGRVEVSLDIGADGQLAARLAFDNPAAALDLRARADELRRQLEAAGFQLAGDALDFSERDARSGGGFDRRHDRASAFADGSRLTDRADAAPVASPWIALSLTPDRVDMKV